MEPFSGKKESKAFFLEKKNQNTFASLALLYSETPQPG
jgi:hypothetical protein